MSRPVVTVLGARGLVGSAFVRLLAHQDGVELRAVTRANYAAMAGRESDVVVDAAGNAKKYLADDDPAGEFDLSVGHRLRTLRDFPGGLQVHVSSVDVYPDLANRAATAEDVPLDGRGSSRYGFHKLLAEQYVRYATPRWLIVRLAGMVGPGLRKNPVFDILHDCPLRIHPDSQYQFMHTDDVAALVWRLVEGGCVGDVFNVCGQGLVSPRDIAVMAGRRLDLSALPSDAVPRIVDVSNMRLAKRVVIPDTRSAVERYLAEEASLRRGGAPE